MNRLAYKLTLWSISFLLSLLLMGCDNSDHIEKQSELNNSIAQEAYDISRIFKRGAVEENKELTQEALIKISEFIERYPNDNSAIELRSTIYTYINDPLTREIYKINELAFQGAVQKKENLKKEALKMASDLIARYPNNAETLRLRSDIYMYLDKPYESLADLEKSNIIAPYGEAKFSECFRRDKLPDAQKNTEQSKSCYKEAMRFFEKSLKYPEKDINYVFAGLLSGNKKAMGQFEALVIEDRKKDRYLGLYEGIAQEYFGKTLDELFPPKNK